MNNFYFVFLVLVSHTVLTDPQYNFSCCVLVCVCPLASSLSTRKPFQAIFDVTRKKKGFLVVLAI